MKTPQMFEIITTPLSDIKFELYKIVLVCDRETHIKRMILDNRGTEQIESDDSMEPYYVDFQIKSENIFKLHQADFTII